MEPRPRSPVTRGRLAFAALSLVAVGCALGGSARISRPGRYEAGRAFLVAPQKEARGYGLYSYVLLAGPPTGATRELYRETIAAWLEYVQPIEQYEARENRDRLNVTYMPVIAPPPTSVAEFRSTTDNARERAAATTWVLDHYDYANARLLLGAVERGRGDGPYLVSAIRPLSESPPAPGSVLRQDLSGTPPEFARSWMREFLNQAATPAEWTTTSLSRFVLTLRTSAMSVASAWPEVRDSIRQRVAVAK